MAIPVSIYIMHSQHFGKYLVGKKYTVFLCKYSVTHSTFFCLLMNLTTILGNKTIKINKKICCLAMNTINSLASSRLLVLGLQTPAVRVSTISVTKLDGNTPI